MRLHTPATLLALACMAMAAPPAVAQGVTVYGRMTTTVNSIKTGNTVSVRELRDNASRLGFRGVEDLGGGLEAMYGLEMGLSVDNGTVTDPALRNSYVALRGGWGALALGRLDSANPTGSPLYSQMITLTSFAPNDAGATATSTSMMNARNRTSNSIGYISPTRAGFNVRARYYLRGAGTTAEAEDAARSLDLGLNYAASGFKAALGMARDSRSGGLAANEFEDKWQAGANLTVAKGLEVYALGGVDRYKNTAVRRRDVSYLQLGTAYRWGTSKLVFNVFRREVQSSLTGIRNRQQLSYQYFLSKRSELQFFVDSDGIDSSRSNVRVRAMGMGIRHDF